MPQALSLTMVSLMRMKIVKKLTLLLLTAAISVLRFQIVYCGSAPDFTLTDIDEYTFSLSDFRGKVVILNFFSSRCGPCNTEMSHLKAVQNEFGTKLTIISISIRLNYDTDEILRQFRDDHDITWIVARDTANVRGKYDVPAIPTLYIIGREGYIKHYHHGLTEASTLIQEINEINVDLNNDEIVNIQDLFIVAKAYGSHGSNIPNPGDPHSEKWNPVADVTKDGWVNIRDLFEVAKDYGKTV